MTQSNDTSEIKSIISGNFEIELPLELTYEALVLMLASRIRDMLDRNVERLLSILYRIDLNQKKVDVIFENTSKDDIAIELARAVIERQEEKVETRKKYKNPGKSIE